MNADPSFIKEFFRAKRQQLLAVSKQAVAKHPSLIGSHREELIKLYLKEILPQRFDIGKGMVYDADGNKTKEGDIIIYDGDNYPNLTLLGHSLYFAESVKLVLEIKSSWSGENLNDILVKSEHVKSLKRYRVLGIPELLGQYREGEVVSDFRTISPPKIGFASLFIRGGNKIKLARITRDRLTKVAFWPDIMCFLEEGIIVCKRLSPDPSHGMLVLYKLAEDTLLYFTSELLSSLSDKMVNYSEKFYF